MMLKQHYFILIHLTFKLNIIFLHANQLLGLIQIKKRCIYGKNRFCMLKNGKHAKYAK